MTSNPHILIIGAGLIGLATARACVDLGAAVTLAERRPQTGCGAGYANSGMIHPSQAWPWVVSGLDGAAQFSAAQITAGLAQSAVPKLKARMQALGLPAINRAAGCVQIFDTPNARTHAAARYQSLKIKTQPQNILGRPALLFPADFSGSAYAWSQAETQALIQDGVKIQTDAQVSLSEKNGQIIATINADHVKADHVIICTGHQANTLLTPLGLPLPIAPTRGFAVNFDVKNIELTSLPPMPIMDARSHSALTLFEGVLRLSGTLGEQSARPLWQRWCALMPDIMARLGPPVSIWSGYRPISGLGRPIIAQTPIGGLWVNSGHGHMGWTLSMASGDIMANMVIKAQTAPQFSWPA